jgi:hypothetical protein
MFIEGKGRVTIRGVPLSKSVVKGKPRNVLYRDEIWLPLKGDREDLTVLVLNYLRLLQPDDRLFPFSLRKYTSISRRTGKPFDQLVGTKRAWAIVKSVLPDFTCHWLRAFGEDYLYTNWDHDLMAVADYVKVDARTLQHYLRKSYKKYENKIV